MYSNAGSQALKPMPGDITLKGIQDLMMEIDKKFYIERPHWKGMYDMQWPAIPREFSGIVENELKPNNKPKFK